MTTVEPIDWLLQGPPFVRYRTLCDLVGESPKSRAARRAHEAMLAEPLVDALIGRVNAWERH